MPCDVMDNEYCISCKFVFYQQMADVKCHKNGVCCKNKLFAICFKKPWKMSENVFV